MDPDTVVKIVVAVALVAAVGLVVLLTAAFFVGADIEVYPHSVSMRSGETVYVTLYVRRLPPLACVEISIDPPLRVSPEKVCSAGVYRVEVYAPAGLETRTAVLTARAVLLGMTFGFDSATVTVVSGEGVGTAAEVSLPSSYSFPIAFYAQNAEIMVGAEGSSVDGREPLFYRGTVSVGTEVWVYIYLEPVDGDRWCGNVRVVVKKDVVGWMDSVVREATAYVCFDRGGKYVPITSFKPTEKTDSSWYCSATHCTRGYFVELYVEKSGGWERIRYPADGDPNTRPEVFTR